MVRSLLTCECLTWPHAPSVRPRHFATCERMLHDYAQVLEKTGLHARSRPERARRVPEPRDDQERRCDVQTAVLRKLSLLATIGMLCCPAVASGQNSAPAPTTRIYGGYSVNADYIANVPYMVVFNQPVSPFFSLGGGPYGFEASIERGLRGRLGLKASVSRYVDPFSGNAAYCQPPSLCATRVTFEDHTSVM